MMLGFIKQVFGAKEYEPPQVSAPQPPPQPSPFASSGPTTIHTICRCELCEMARQQSDGKIGIAVGAIPDGIVHLFMSDPVQKLRIEAFITPTTARELANWLIDNARIADSKRNLMRAVVARN